MDVAILIGFIIVLVTLILITWRLPHAIHEATLRGLNKRPIPLWPPPQPERRSLPEPFPPLEAPAEAVNSPQPEAPAEAVDIPLEEY